MNWKKAIVVSITLAVLGYALAARFLGGYWYINIPATLLCGALGWIVYDPQGLWNTAIEVVEEKIEEMEGVRRDRRHWKRLLLRARRNMVEGVIVAEMIACAVGCCLFVLVALGEKSILYSLELGAALYIGVFIVGSIGSICFQLNQLCSRAGRYALIQTKKEEMRISYKFNKTALFIVNPFVIFFAVGWVLCCVIGNLIRWFCVSMLPFLAVGFVLLVVKICVSAHTNGRLICFAGSSLGMAAGIYADHILVAGLAGFAVSSVSVLICRCVTEGHADYWSRKLDHISTTTPSDPG